MAWKEACHPSRQSGARTCGKRSSRVADHWPHLMKAAPLCRMPSSSRRHARMRSRAAQRSAQLPLQGMRMSISTQHVPVEHAARAHEPRYKQLAAIGHRSRAPCRPTQNTCAACKNSCSRRAAPVIQGTSAACSRRRDLLDKLDGGECGRARRPCRVLLRGCHRPAQAGPRGYALVRCYFCQGDARRRPAGQPDMSSQRHRLSMDKCRSWTARAGTMSQAHALCASAAHSESATHSPYFPHSM